MNCVQIMWFIIFLVLFCSHYSFGSFSNKLTLPPKQDVHEFWLDVEYRVSMSNHDDDGAQPLYYKIDTEKFQRRTPCADYEEFNQTSDVIIGDGLHRFVIAFNHTVPGPTLVVYRNSTIIVHVTNKADEPISVHWHGLEMRGAFFMDGVGMVSQCPIMTGQKFTYKFQITDPAGTYWYHGHTGVNIGDGLYGALIVVDKDDDKYTDHDYIVVVSDWFPAEASHFSKHVIFDNEEYIRDYEDQEHCYKMTRDTTKSKVGQLPWNSAVINGKGWHNVTELKAALTSGKNMPIEKFIVSSKTQLKIRLISAAFVFPLIVSVSGHKLVVVAIDSRPILPVTVDYVTIMQGERYDVLIEPMNGVSKGTHVMLAESTERFDEEGNELEEFKDHFVPALVIYDKEEAGPVSNFRRSCTTEKPCTILNCNSQSYPSSFGRTCIHMTDLKNLEDPPKVILSDKPDGIQQTFINIFSEEPGYTLNGIQNVMPTAPLFMRPTAYTKCAEDCSFKHKCICTHILPVTVGKVVEFVIYNRPKELDQMLDEGFGHPFHTHGHHFYVMEVGWATHHANGTIKNFNLATTCEHWYCNKASWNETNSYLRPKTRNQKPVSKDTVYIPVGGYVVIRFVADNPGWWLAHCHQGPHHSFGMAVILKEGESKEMANVPDDFPVCGFSMKDVKQNY